ncbi:MAG: hypothetical protein U9R25_05510 [Chloroflexota bacterium]|nr:hypothetical protein [Chloroflexota bacterium]
MSTKSTWSTSKTNRLLNFATVHPFLFVLLAIAGWILLGSLGTVVAMFVLDAPFTDVVVQSTGSLVATACVLALAWRWGWLKSAGITRLGGLRLWLITLAAAVYVIIAYQLAFFGEIALNLDQLNGAEAHQILMHQAVVGFAEETMFRGILLFALVRVWGDSRNFLIKSLQVRVARQS